jgi:hypothetical protein
MAGSEHLGVVVAASGGVGEFHGGEQAFVKLRVAAFEQECEAAICKRHEHSLPEPTITDIKQAAGDEHQKEAAGGDRHFRNAGENR